MGDTLHLRRLDEVEATIERATSTSLLSDF
jgi:hypothetical protein